jgi:hypothetical protein
MIPVGRSGTGDVCSVLGAATPRKGAKARNTAAAAIVANLMVIALPGRMRPPMAIPFSYY